MFLFLINGINIVGELVLGHALPVNLFVFGWSKQYYECQRYQCGVISSCLYHNLKINLFSIRLNIGAIYSVWMTPVIRVPKPGNKETKISYTSENPIYMNCVELSVCHE